MDRRVPVGLTFSMFTAVVSLGTILVLWNLAYLAPQGWSNVVHSAAILCVFWAVVGYVLQRSRPAFIAQPIGGDLLAVLDIAALVMGLLAFILMFFSGSVEAVRRTLEFRYGYRFEVNIWPSGLLDLAAVSVAVLLGYRRAGNRRLMTALFWILTFACLWVVFYCIPAVREVRTESGFPHAVATDWTSPFILSVASILCVFTVAGGVAEHRRRVRAWPHNLADLTTPLKPWPGFLYSAGLVGAMILVLGCVHVVKPWNSLAMFLAGGSMLALGARRWNENFADTGFALLTLGVVSLFMVGLCQPENVTESYYADVFGRVVAGLAIMVGFWHWLASLWDQQLDRGEPWTTAGRLIRVARRVGFIIAAIAILVSVNLSFWPLRPNIVGISTGPSQWIWGVTAHGLLMLALIGAARRTGKPTLGWLALFALCSLIAFVVVRTPTAVLSEWIIIHWPFATALIAGLFLLLASLATQSARWQPFFEPLFLTGVLIAPLTSILGALSPAHSPAMPSWVPAATYGLLTAVYVLAAVATGPRTFSAVAVVCGAIAIWYLLELRPSPNMDSIHARAALIGVLVGASLWLMSLIYRHEARPAAVGLMKGMGGVLLAVSVIALFVASLS